MAGPSLGKLKIQTCWVHVPAGPPDLQTVALVLCRIGRVCVVGREEGGGLWLQCWAGPKCYEGPDEVEGRSILSLVASASL